MARTRQSRRRRRSLLARHADESAVEKEPIAPEQDTSGDAKNDDSEPVNATQDSVAQGDDKPAEDSPEDVKPEDAKPEEAKAETAEQGDAKPKEAKAEESKSDEVKPEEAKAEVSKSDEVKPEEAKPEAAEQDDARAAAADDPPEQVPEETAEKSDTAAKAKKSKKNKTFDLPSQEEAEAATKGFPATEPSDKAQGEQGEKKTWASYLPTIRGGAKKDPSTEQKSADEKAAGVSSTGEKSAEEQKDGPVDEHGQRRTWAEYASSAYSALPSIPSIPSLPESWKSKDGKAEPVYNEDGTVNEEKTKEKQEREASVLLDHLNLSSINNRVFAFSGETEKIYERFTQVLKDTMNGGPTAYEDMEKLMKDAGPELEKQFKSMPPFVQTLVKSLPAKLGTSLGPELLAAASEKPGGDMQARMKAASKQPSSGGDPSIQTASASSSKEETTQDGQKKKRRIPGLKGLVSEQGMVASILRNVVSFLKVRFPFLASMTNVVMSLAVFSKSTYANC